MKIINLKREYYLLFMKNKTISLCKILNLIGMLQKNITFKITLRVNLFSCIGKVMPLWVILTDSCEPGYERLVLFVYQTILKGSGARCHKVFLIIVYDRWRKNLFKALIFLYGQAMSTNKSILNTYCRLLPK